MHVLQVSFFVDPACRPPERLLSDWFSLVDIAEAAASTGARVTMVQANRVEGVVTRNGIDYHFIAPERDGAALTGGARFAALLRALAPDIVHVHGFGFARELLGLHALEPRLPIFLQHHADGLPRFWRRGRWRRGVQLASGASFCARAQAEPFERARLLAPHTLIFEIPESTTRFAAGDRAAARAATGLHGDPALLWVGHLDPNKDPLTVLAGVAEAARDLPDLTLWCCYSQAPLLGEVQAFIARHPALRDRVHLLGRVPWERVQELMRAADLFVHGSHREGGSYSLVEALASGLVPVVTDIPALRALTADGGLGALWTAGNAREFAAALRRVAGACAEQRARVLAHFEAQLSPRAFGRRLRAAYADTIERHALGAAAVARAHV